MTQASLDSLNEDLIASRLARLLPRLEAGLNTAQLRALNHRDGPALILAGAGSGKTTVLIRRTARLLTEGIDAKNILVATFTKKAADEMKQRLVALLGDGGEAIVEKLWIGTFHSHCLRILKHEWAHLYGTAGGYFHIQR